MNLEWFHVDQLTLIVAALALASLARQKNIWLFLIAGAASFLQGGVAAALFAGFVFGDRLSHSAPLWMKIKDAMSLFFIIAASALPHPMMELFCVLGVFGISIHSERDGFSAVTPLILAHIYFNGLVFPELVLGAFGFFVVLREIFIFSKLKHTTLILRCLEIPVLLCILFPFKDYGQTILEDQELWIPGAIVLTVLLGFYSWLLFKPENFVGFQGLQRRKSEALLEKTNHLIPVTRHWIKEKSDADLVVSDDFEITFWTSVVVGAVFLVLVFLVKGDWS